MMFLVAQHRGAGIGVRAGEAGRPAVLNEDGALRADGIGETFRNLAESLMHRPM